MTRTPNAQLNLAKPDSLSVRIATRVRRKMFAEFMEFFRPNSNNRILDVGVTSDRSYTSSNYFEELYPWKSGITAVGLDEATFLELRYPGLRFVQANALQMPFGNDEFDYVHCAAVLEHVGSSVNQRKLIEECTRVARLGICLTTPNRWYPIEFHTQVPLLHMLPKRVYRELYRFLGLQFFAREENLNLVSEREIRALTANIAGWCFTFRSQRLLGLKSNILVFGKCGGAL